MLDSNTKVAGNAKPPPRFLPVTFHPAGTTYIPGMAQVVCQEAVLPLAGHALPVFPRVFTACMRAVAVGHGRRGLWIAVGGRGCCWLAPASFLNCQSATHHEGTTVVALLLTCRRPMSPVPPPWFVRLCWSRRLPTLGLCAGLHAVCGGRLRWFACSMACSGPARACSPTCLWVRQRTQPWIYSRPRSCGAPTRWLWVRPRCCRARVPA